MGATTLYPAACLVSSGLPGWCGSVLTDIGLAINTAEYCLHVQSSGAGAGVVQLPAGTFTPTTAIQPLYSGVAIAGAGAAATVINSSSSIGAFPLFCNPTSTPNIGIRIHDLQINNSANTTSSNADGIHCESCAYPEIDHISSNAGGYGIAMFGSNTSSTSNARIHDNLVPSAGWGGIMNIGYSTNVWIERNTILDCRNGDSNHCYGISASGIGSTPFNAASANNVWVLNNYVTNAPYWECYDSHGGSYQTFEGNYGTNCPTGIMVGTISGSTLTHVVIRGNHLISGTVTPSNPAYAYGIVLQENSYSNPVTDSVIDSNYVDGYGSANSASQGMVGGIDLDGTTNVTVSNNVCPTYNQSCITLNALNMNPIITGNQGGTMLGFAFGSATSTAMIDVASEGTWGAYVDNNVSTPNPTSSTYAPLALFYNRSYIGSVGPPAEAPSEASQVDFGPNNRLNGPAYTTVVGTASIAFANYVSGGTFGGSTYAGATCTFTFAGSGSSSNPGTATVTLNSSGTISAGAALAVTNSGSALMSTTSATLSSTPAAACNGTATVTSITGTQTTLVSGGWYAVGLPALPTYAAGFSFNYRSGTVGYDNISRSAYIFTSPNATPYASPYSSTVPAGGGGFYALDSTTQISTAETTINSPQITAMAATPDGASEAIWLPVGMNICVAGSGVAGTPLCGRIMANDGVSTITLDRPASISHTTTPFPAITWQSGQINNAL